MLRADIYFLNYLLYKNAKHITKRIKTKGKNRGIKNDKSIPIDKLLSIFDASEPTNEKKLKLLEI